MISVAHPLEHSQKARFGKLTSKAIIAWRSCELLDRTRRIFANHGTRPRCVLPSDSNEGYMIMIAAGIGAVTAPMCFLARHRVGRDRSMAPARQQPAALRLEGKAFP